MREIFIKIFGDVQGVGFRYQTVQKARELNLTGWVRNAPDGSVEILAQGSKENLEKLAQWAKTGPKIAEVTDMQIEWREMSASYSDFEISH
ncbi:MAG: acylphosphatase [Candidatus Doudnabacteria bacterium]|nr:acylphosphatase [Candidatus Doudnabacteria bacterium]